MGSLLVTGGAGFIGSNFIHYWIKKYPNQKIIVLDSLTYASNINSIKDLINQSKINFIKGNITDEKLILNIFGNYQITYLLNFAAETHVDRSIDSPDSFINSNILGTYNLLKCFKKYWEENDKPPNWRFLQVSTDEVFGSLNADDNRFTELSSYKPRSPYSASKASADHLVQAWNDTYDLPTLITNCSNNYGPFQYPEKLIPLTITNLLMSKEIPVYGDGLNIRDWLFVEDHCRAIDRVISNANPGQKFCIGANNEVKNVDLINKICTLVDKYALTYNYKINHSKSSDLIKFVSDRPGHDKRYAIDSSKLINELNWETKTSFEEGLEKTILWYLKNKNWWEPLTINN
ncbi:MAG: dTDP-glucose 4,6-dehydratase [Prochlorococcus marinus CUG1439]|uniref:dTDP-glucose 4,6-dehydratase n=1 Tax=Prochlorococcus sp. MIT 1314 TaxID=3096220 RepID=UPI001B120424|nr:dTDP-glucose 4,6-dehydratase [Prochlorococcus sp. MIT 1314]MCR8538786.1 dTDP-glucose 4,6-dehydratase [Prochlorococcus marinus CUG1439]